MNGGHMSQHKTRVDRVLTGKGDATFVAEAWA
jgi:hypothetical protein